MKVMASHGRAARSPAMRRPCPCINCEQLSTRAYGQGKSRTRGEKDMDAKTDDSAGKCPVMHGHANRDWWPTQLDVSVLHRNSSLSDPMDAEFNYAKEFKTLDLNAVIKD